MPLRADSESVHERDHSTFRVHWSVVATPMSARGVDPRSNLTVGPEIPDTTPARYQSVLDASARAARHLTWSDRTARGRWLAALADRLEASQAQLVTLADQETALGQPRLEGELRRTTSQLRLFADVVRDGGYLQATWDRPDPSTTPPRPDLRSFGLPIGPVAIWPASNFPFAFGNLGTDTASALAAGCPVLVKSHPAHPATSSALGVIALAALSDAGAPDGTFAVLHGEDVGRILVSDSRVRAGAFTGSIRAGRLLFDLACRRDAPIPFYAEMGSTNPVYVLPKAAGERPGEIAKGLVSSITLGVGQFCTKPGIVFVPKASTITAEVALLVHECEPAPMLTNGLRSGFQSVLEQIASRPGVEVLATGTTATARNGAWVTPTLARMPMDLFLVDHRDVAVECFGPFVLLVEYDEPDELLQAAELTEGGLTATVHAEPDDVANGLWPRLFGAIVERAGRIVWNGWPTGVAVGWAIHHGGPYPATTSTSTSVGAHAIARFVRTVCFQDFPDHLLPAELRATNPQSVPRRVGEISQTER